jgi:CHAT domain-containing protein
MLQSVRFYLNNYLTLMAQSGQYTELGYREMLAWKGIVLRRQRQLRAAEENQELAPVFAELQRVATQLARLAWATPDPKQEAGWRQRVAKLSEEEERLEAELSSRSTAYRQAKRQATLEELQAALPRDVVLVDFIEYRHYTPANKKKGTKESWQRRFLAFLVTHDHPVEMASLGAAGPIGEAIDAWRVTFGMSGPGVAAARLLRQRVWEPIEARLHGAKIVLVSPDGVLAKLPLGALPGKQPGKYLLEEQTIAIVPVAQLIPEIVREQGRKQLQKNLLLLGNVDYDAQPGAAKPDAPAKPKKFGRELPKGLTHFGELPQTRGEIATIEKLYRQNFGNEGISPSLEQARATKQAFLAAAGQYRYLHLATHGFFVEDNLPSVPALLADAGNRFGEMLRRPEAGGLHPGLLCGLALAGANRAGRPDASEADDGILTAEEIATQDLDGVQLVVLSACETGLGQSAGGEGLLGLQRAFQSAGARSVVASLWTVDDEKTRSLMERFYENHWQKNLGVLEALREAQLWLLHGRPDRNWVRTDAPPKSTTLSPQFWAAFALSGDWR